MQARAPFSFGSIMPTDPTLDYDESGEVDSADIRQAATEIAAGGVASFSDGQHNVTAADPEKLLKIADKLQRDDAASTAINSIFANTVRLRSPGAWS